MTEKQKELVRDRIKEAIQYWRYKLYLDLWEIYLDYEPPSTHKALAEIETIEGMHSACLFINLDKFVKATPHERNVIILHEMLHIPLEVVRDKISSMTEHMSIEAYSMLSRLVKNEFEFVVDRLTTVISQMVEVPVCLDFTLEQLLEDIEEEDQSD
jgi:predicted metallopeptidase